MGRYTELHSFVQVAHKGSFAAAALNEGVTPAILGRRLDALEKRLGVKLMHRSTRGLKLTEAGEQLLEGAKQLMREFDVVESSISNSSATVCGHLVVSAPAAFWTTSYCAARLWISAAFSRTKVIFQLYGQRD